MLKKSLRLLSLVVLLSAMSFGTAVRGTLVNGSGNPLPGGTLTLTLSSVNLTGATVSGCGDGTAPNVRNSGTITQMTTVITAGAGGALFGTVVGNDQINCGTGFGVGTFYVVTAKDPTGVQQWSHTYNVTGATWTPSATPLSVLPPSILAVAIVANPAGNQTIVQPGGTSLTINGILNATLTGNATTATALAGNGSNCAVGSFAAGVDASGNAEGCTPLPLSIAGTTNQVNVSASTGSITLSLPQNIATTSSPTFAGLTINGAAAASSLSATTSIAGATFSLVATSNGIDISTMRRSTDTSPTGNFQRYRNAANSSDLWAVDITGSLVAGIIPAARVSGVLAAGNLPNPTASTLGGIQSFAAVSHQWINSISTSGVPSGSQPAFTDISGTATATQGGTGQSTYAVGDVLVAGSTTTLSRLALGTNGLCLTSNGTTVVWSSCSTGAASLSANQTFIGINTFSNATGIIVDKLTAATAGGNITSPALTVNASVWNGAAAVNDSWTLSNVPGSGSNPTVTWTLGHTAGGSGTASIDFSAAASFKATVINATSQFQVGGSQISASNLSNGVTGSGAIVLAASPSLTGAVTLTAAGSAGFTARSGATGSNTQISIGRTTDEHQIAAASAAGQFFTNSDLAAGDLVVRVLSSTNRLYLGAGSGLAPVAVTNTGVNFYGSTSGSTAVRASATASGTLTLPAATDTLVGKATTDIFTNKSFDTGGTGNSFKINGSSITAVTGSTQTVVLSTSPTIFGGILYGGSTSGTTTLISAATASGTLTLPSATDTLVGKTTTDILTNKSLDAEGTGNNITSPVKLWYEAAGCNNASPTPFWDTSTATVPSAVCVTGTNVVKGLLRFAVNTQQFAQFHYLLPADLKSATTWDLNLLWTTATVSGTATFQVDYACTTVGSTATDDPAFTAWQTISATASATANAINKQSVTGATTTCTAGQIMHFRVKRTDTAGTATNADVYGLELTYRRTM